MNELKTLEEANRLALAEYDRKGWDCLNGIACPRCGAELLDSDPRYVLASYPPQLNIHCTAEGCGYRGYRVK